MGDQSRSYIGGHSNFEQLSGDELHRRTAKRIESLFEKLDGWDYKSNSWGMAGGRRTYPVSSEFAGRVFDVVFIKIADRSNQAQLGSIQMQAARIDNSFGAGLILQVNLPNRYGIVCDEHGQRLSGEQLEGLAGDLDVLEAKLASVAAAKS